MVTLCFPGHVNASFCPHGYGCRSVVMSENQIILDVTDHEVILTLRVPDRKTLWLVSVSMTFSKRSFEFCVQE